MKKPFLLREYLLVRTPWLNDDPNRLATFIENGSIVSKGDGSLPSSSLCYEQQYTLTIIVLDFPGGPEEIFVPILEWLQTHQPDLMHNPDWQKTGFSFDAEVIDNDLYDLTVSLQLTERMIASVKDANATISAERYEVKNSDEPQYVDLLHVINGIHPGIDPTQP